MTSDNNAQKKCGFCGESVPVYATRCPYCASLLEVTFDNSYRINPVTSPEDPAINHGDHEDHGEGAWPENAGQGQAARNAEEGRNATGSERPTYGSGGYVPGRRPEYDMRNPLSNGMKVFLTVLFTIIPGLGQLAGIITAIVFMNTEGDSDRKSFGVALLVASLVMFVFACIGCFIMVIALSSSNQFNY